MQGSLKPGISRGQQSCPATAQEGAPQPFHPRPGPESSSLSQFCLGGFMPGFIHSLQPASLLLSFLPINRPSGPRGISAKPKLHHISLPRKPFHNCRSYLVTSGNDLKHLNALVQAAVRVTVREGTWPCFLFFCLIKNIPLETLKINISLEKFFVE